MLKEIVRKWGWEVTAGLAVVAMMFLAGIVASVSYPDDSKNVLDDSWCTPAVFGQSVKDPGKSSRISSVGEGVREVDELTGEVISPDAQIQEEPCSRSYVFGTDVNGLDIFRYAMSSLVSYGIPAVVVVAVTILIGSLFGVVAGYFSEHWTSSVSAVVSNAISVYPPLILLIIVVYIRSDASLLLIAFVFGLTESTRLGYLIMNKITVLKQEEFIAAAKEMGLSDRQIIWKHILWYNCRELLVIQSVFSISSFIMIELYLGYLNKAANLHGWGKLIGPTAAQLPERPWLILPSIAVVVMIGAFYLIGDGLIRRFGGEQGLSK
jgi:peptide/nickel transport system permease protein